MRKPNRRSYRAAPAALACAALACATAQAADPQFPSLEPPIPQSGAGQLTAYQPPPVPPPAAGDGETPRLPETTIEGGLNATPAPTPGPPTQPTNFPQPPAGRTPAQVFNDTFNPTVEGTFLPDVEGTYIFGGKKTENIDLQDRPPILNNSLRQVFQETPGLLVSEESSPLTSIGYRGLNPHRAQFMQILKDGIPIHADMFGYPEAYYVPAFQTIERIEFVHGGASLMYGPQPGGSLNFITKSPDPNVNCEAYTENVWGTNNFFSTYSSISGTPGPMGYYGYFHHRETDGFRTSNSQYSLNYGGAKFITRLSPTEQVITGFDLYQEQHGEPGGLSRAAFFGAGDRTTTTRVNDRFQFTRYAAYAKYQAELDEELFFQTSIWYAYVERSSRRRGGGGFGTVPTGGTTSLEQQQFHNFGFEPRVRRDWGDDSQHTLAYGATFYHTDSPRVDSTSTNFAITNFVGPNVVRANERETNYLGLFIENRFVFDRLTLTPGFRMENLWQSVTEGVNATPMYGPLKNETLESFAPLFGLGATYDLTDTWQAYGNISQAYRPPLFTEAVVLGANQTIAGDLAEGESYQADVGLRANLWPYLTVDTSLFYLDFSNQIGLVSNVVQNVGAARHRGAEFSGRVDFVRWNDDLNNTNYADEYGSLIAFYNGMWLDAQYYGGPFAGRTPAYAPNYIQRAGVEWKYDTTAVRFAGTWLNDHWGDDGNSANFVIPAYTVWDLTANFQVCEHIAVVAGINNIFDEFYTSRIRSDGIDPAQGRNYYLGFQAGY